MKKVITDMRTICFNCRHVLTKNESDMRHCPYCHASLYTITYPWRNRLIGFIKIERGRGIMNEYDETAIIIDKHNEAKSILDKWEVKLKSKLNYNNFDMAVIAKGKDIECVGCIYALRLMVQPPCDECKQSDHLYFTKENPMEWPEFKNCYNCKHRNKLVTEEPCRTCLSLDNDLGCWEFKEVIF